MVGPRRGKIPRHAMAEQRLHQPELGHSMWLSHREHERARHTRVDGDDGGRLLTEHIEQVRDVGCDGVGVVAALRSSAGAEPAQIGSDDAVRLGQVWDDLAPHSPGVRPTVQQDDRRALPRHVTLSSR